MMYADVLHGNGGTEWGQSNVSQGFLNFLDDFMLLIQLVLSTTVSGVVWLHSSTQVFFPSYSLFHFYFLVFLEKIEKIEKEDNFRIRRHSTLLSGGGQMKRLSVVVFPALASHKADFCSENC
jgi:hypothetical protein